MPTNTILGEGYAEKGIAKEHGFDVDSAQKLAVSSAAQLMQGEEIRTSDGDWDILMGPVLARTKECLSCHKEATMGGRARRDGLCCAENPAHYGYESKFALRG